MYLFTVRTNEKMSASDSISIDPFELLGLSQDGCTAEQARRAFSDLVLLVHPDKGGRAVDMRVVTSAYRYVRRCVAAKEAIEMDFGEYYNLIDDGTDWERGTEMMTGLAGDRNTAAFDLAAFNRAFDSRNPHLIYAGPAPDEPTEGRAVRMAAAGGGTSGEGYGSGMDGGDGDGDRDGDRDDLERPCAPLVQNQLVVRRELPHLLPRIVPEHGATSLIASDYALAHAAPAPYPAPGPAPADLESAMDVLASFESEVNARSVAVDRALERELEARNLTVGSVGDLLACCSITEARAA